MPLTNAQIAQARAFMAAEKRARGGRRAAPKKRAGRVTKKATVSAARSAAGRKGAATRKLQRAYMPARMPAGYVDPVYATTNEDAQIEAWMPARRPVDFVDEDDYTPARRPSGWVDPVDLGSNDAYIGQAERNRKWAAIAARIAKN